MNGETYSSKCAAHSVRVLVDYEGPCAAIGYVKGQCLHLCYKIIFLFYNSEIW